MRSCPDEQAPISYSYPFITSVIVNDLHVVSSLFRETNAPLIIDPNTVLAQPVTLEGLQPISGRNCKLIKVNGHIAYSG